MLVYVEGKVLKGSCFVVALERDALIEVLRAEILRSLASGVRRTLELPADFRLYLQSDTKHENPLQNHCRCSDVGVRDKCVVDVVYPLTLDGHIPEKVWEAADKEETRFSRRVLTCRHAVVWSVANVVLCLPTLATPFAANILLALASSTVVYRMMPRPTHLLRYDVMKARVRWVRFWVVVALSSWLVCVSWHIWGWSKPCNSDASPISSPDPWTQDWFRKSLTVRDVCVDSTWEGLGVMVVLLCAVGSAIAGVVFTHLAIRKIDRKKENPVLQVIRRAGRRSSGPVVNKLSKSSKFHALGTSSIGLAGRGVGGASALHMTPIPAPPATLLGGGGGFVPPPPVSYTDSLLRNGAGVGDHAALLGSMGEAANTALDEESREYEYYDYDEEEL